MDEPSIGMDPEARNDMWNIINKLSAKKNCSVFLATNSMEEADVLSKRIAILVKGELKCIGDKNLLKNKFGKGYEIDLKIICPTEEEIRSLV